MRVVVTGGAGFIGSHFVHRLVDGGDEVVVLDKLTYAGNRSNLEGVRCEFHHGDIADSEAVARACEGCEAIVNFAAESHVDRSIIDGTDLLDTNIAGTVVLLEAARARGIRLVQVSTDEVYGDVPPGSASLEGDPLTPSSPYSAAKAAGELFVLAHVRTYGVNALITRGSNTYGPNQYPEKLLALFITNALDGESLPLYGDGRQVRDWLHVEDHCGGIELALRQGRAGEAYNLGGGEEVTNLEITDRVLELTGADRSLVQPVADRPGHDRRYRVDSTKAESELGWQRAWSLQRGLPQTVEWYRGHRDWWEAIKHSPGYRAYYERQYAQRLAR